MYWSSVLQQYPLIKYVQCNVLGTQRDLFPHCWIIPFFKENGSTRFSILEFKELVSTGDGDYRMVYAINGKIPGPEIVVTEGDVVSL